GVGDASRVGALLSAVVMLLFLRSSRAALVATLAIPASLAAACAVIRVTGGSLNLMSLGGLAIAVGLVIDDAVVVVEAIHRALAAGHAPRAAAAMGTQQLAGPVFSSTLTTVVVFTPLGFLQGVVGAFFAALAIGLAAAVLLSLVIALTVIPMLSALLLEPMPVTQEREPMQRPYQRLLAKALKRPLLTISVAVAVVLVGGVVATRVETGFLP